MGLWVRAASRSMLVGFWACRGPIVGAGLLLAGYLFFTTRRVSALLGFLCLAISGAVNILFPQLWGWHNLLGWRFPINENELFLLEIATLLTGIILTALAIYQHMKRH